MNDSSFIANGGNFTFPDKANVRPERLFFRLPLDRINWLTSSFLIGTLALTLTAVPLYLWFFGLDWFQVVLFFAMLAACGFSVTLGYHRLFSHITFQASWPIRLFTLIFGAAAFENSVLMWASEHRRHHKHVDYDDDPYCISKGFFFAHIGWLLFKLKTDQPYDNVADLQKDKLVCWQDRHVQWIAVLVSFGIPAILGGAMVVVIIVEQAGVKLHEPVLTFTWRQVRFTWATVAAAIMLSYLIMDKGGAALKFGGILMLLGAIAMAVGAFMEILGKGTNLLAIPGVGGRDRREETETGLAARRGWLRDAGRSHVS